LNTDLTEKVEPTGHAKSRLPRLGVLVLAVLALVNSSIGPVWATIYVTADDFAGTNLFGTLDPVTGQFTQIATTGPLFLALTIGPGGTIIGADANSGTLYAVGSSGMTAPFGSVTPPAPPPSAYYGLAYSGSAGNFFADFLDQNAMTVTLYSIAGDGNSSSLISELAGPNSGFFPTGNLVFGPGGTLYFNYSSDTVNATNSTLYAVDTSSGTLTAIGSGMGTTILALFSDGTTLYGLDALDMADIGVFRIDTTTGIATQVSTVTGLPDDNFVIDAATFAVPEPSTLALLIVALLVAGGGLRWSFGYATESDIIGSNLTLRKTGRDSRAESLCCTDQQPSEVSPLRPLLM